MSIQPKDIDRAAVPDEFAPLPHNLEAEQCLLGSLLISPADVVPLVLESGFAPREFYRPTHGTIYQAILRRWQDNLPVDLILLTQDLRAAGELERVGGPAYVTHLFTITPSAVTARYYLEIVRELATLRDIYAEASAVAAEARTPRANGPELLERLQLLLTRIARDASTGSRVGTMADLIPNAVDRLEQRFAGRGKLRGIPSGLGLLDRLTDGWQGGQMIVVAAKEKEGKSSLARQFVLEAAVVREVPTAIFSHEMGREEITDALIATRARVNAKLLADGTLSQGDFDKIQAAAVALRDAPIFIFDEADSSVLEFRANARRAVREHGCRLLVLDYLQLVGGQGDEKSRQEEVARVSRNVKLSAKELDVPIIVLSQLNEQGTTRESRAIQQDLDKLIVIEHENPEAEGDGKAWIKVKLQRGGPKGSVPVTWRPAITRFDPLAREDEALPLPTVQSAPWDFEHGK